jgi:hypothetical protein
MGSENPSGADNQQERLFTSDWLVGFVDGEGCFSCPIFRSPSMRLGWQVQPTLAVVQGVSSRAVMEEMVDFFVPFFHANPLRTAKRDNFAKFAEIIELVGLRRHLTVPGLIEIAEIVQTMNFRKQSEVLRILRDHTPTLSPVSGGEDEMARSLRRRREAGGNVSPPFRN